MNSLVKWPNDIIWPELWLFNFYEAADQFGSLAVSVDSTTQTAIQE